MTPDRPLRGLAETLAARSDDELSELLAARADLASPPPRGTGVLAQRALSSASIALTGDGLDLRLGRAVKTLLDYGFGVDDLELYRRQFDLEREEAALIHDKMLHNRPRSIPRIPTDKLIGTLTELGKTLTLRAVRQVATEAHESSDDTYEGGNRAHRDTD